MKVTISSLVSSPNAYRELTKSCSLRAALRTDRRRHRGARGRHVAGAGQSRPAHVRPGRRAGVGGLPGRRRAQRRPAQRGRQHRRRHRRRRARVAVRSPPPRPRSPRSRKLGFTGHRAAPPARHPGGAGDQLTSRPPTRGYHNYAEMTAEINQRVADVPGDRQQAQHRHVLRGPGHRRRQDLRQRRHRRGRARGAVHRTTSTPASTSPSRWRSTCSTCSPTSYGTDSQITQPREQPRDLDRPRPQPGRRRVRHRHRLLPLLAQEPPAQRRLVAPSAPTSTATGATSGAAAAARPARTSSRDLPRRRPPFSAPETAGRRATSSTAGVVGGVQQIKAHIDFHTYCELVLWPYGYTYSEHRRRA